LLVGWSMYYFWSLCMSSFVAFRSRQISLDERSRSSFSLVVYCLCACEDVPPLLVMPTRAASERSRLMRAEFPIRTRRHRSYKEAHSLLGRRVCAWRERKPFSQKLYSIFWSTLLTSSCVNLIHDTQTVITTFQLKYHGIVYLCVVFAHSCFVENPLIWSWDTNPSFLRWFCHNWK
jgi:hypothetical protein